jgi:hypothetical protein
MYQEYHKQRNQSMQNHPFHIIPPPRSINHVVLSSFCEHTHYANANPYQ